MVYNDPCFKKYWYMYYIVIGGVFFLGSSVLLILMFTDRFLAESLGDRVLWVVSTFFFYAVSIFYLYNGIQELIKRRK